MPLAVKLKIDLNSKLFIVLRWFLTRYQINGKTMTTN